MRKMVPRPDLAFDRDVAAALLDDAVDHRQAEAGALARLLGGEEGLEDLRHGSPCGMPVPVSETDSIT